MSAASRRLQRPGAGQRAISTRAADGATSALARQFPGQNLQVLFQAVAFDGDLHRLPHTAAIDGQLYC